MHKIFSVLLAGVFSILFMRPKTASAQYCIPVYTTGCSQGDYISSVSLGGYDVVSGCSSPTNYSSYLGPVLYFGRSYPFTVTIGSAYNQHLGMWVDYNGDGSLYDGFHDAEFAYSSTTPATSFNFTFTPYFSQLSVSGGWTRMRFRCNYYTEGQWVENHGITFNNEACKPRNYGETEDYDIFLMHFPGRLTSDAQWVCYGGNPAPITFSSLPDSPGSYQWYYKNGTASAPAPNDGVGTWVPIPGANSSTYDPPPGLTATRTYACRVTDFFSSYPTGWAENVRQVNVLPPVTLGTIASGDQVFCNSGNPAPITMSALPVGSGAFQYRWYWKENVTSTCPTGSSTAGWTTNSTSPNITGTYVQGGASITFDPVSAGAAGAGRTFAVLITPISDGILPACGAPQWAGSCRKTVVNVCSSFSPGTLASGDQTICNGGAPANIAFSVAPTAGSTYLWYYKNGIAAAPANTDPLTGWTSTGVTTPSYTPAAPLTTSRTYACRVANGANFQWATGARKVTVLPVFNPGTIAAGDQSLCANGNPALISFSSPPSGSGAFTYQWYYKNAIVACPTGNTIAGWTPVSGGTGSSYDPQSANTTGRTFTVLVTPSGTPACGTPSFANNCRKVTVVAPPCASSRVAVSGNEPEAPLDITSALEQNVPNPFTDETRLVCLIPNEAKRASIRVQSLDGRQVTELFISETGRQEVVLKKGLLSPGIYLYSLVVDGQAIAVRKLVLNP